MYKKISLILLAVFSSFSAFAQAEMAFDMRSSGKIYVVVAVMAVIFLGLTIFLFNLDRKITRLENTRKDRKN